MHFPLCAAAFMYFHAVVAYFTHTACGNTSCHHRGLTVQDFLLGSAGKLVQSKRRLRWFTKALFKKEYLEEVKRWCRWVGAGGGGGHKFVCMIGSNNFICLRLCSLANRQWPVSRPMVSHRQPGQLHSLPESRHSYAPMTAALTDFVAPSLAWSCTGK